MSKGMRTVHIGGVPNDKQAAFFASTARYTAYGGARGGGKSWALRRKLVAMCLRYEGIRCLLMRRTLAELKANHVFPILREYGQVVRWHAGESAFIFANGSRIDCGYCDCDRDMLRYQGQEYDIIAIDEATQMTEQVFTVLKACLRGVGDYPRRMYLTCNPGGVGHAWVKRLFVDRAYRAGEDAEEYCFIPARVTDNPVLMRADPRYVKQLESLPPRMRDAWLYGHWDVFEGQFFPEFSEERHVFPEGFEGEVPTGKMTETFVSMDYGFDRLAALLIARGADGRLSVLSERCASGLTLREAARQVVSLCAGRAVRYVVASPDLWNRRQDSGLSGVAVMQSVSGMPPMRRADDRRVEGWRLLREYLHGEDGVPRLRISASCCELIECMKGLLCDPTRTEDASDHPHHLTHAPEALRYGVRSVPSLSEDSERQMEDFRFASRGDGIVWS